MKVNIWFKDKLTVNYDGKVVHHLVDETSCVAENNEFSVYFKETGKEPERYDLEEIKQISIFD